MQIFLFSLRAFSVFYLHYNFQVLNFLLYLFIRIRVFSQAEIKEQLMARKGNINPLDHCITANKRYCKYFMSTVTYCSFDSEQKPFTPHDHIYRRVREGGGGGGKGINLTHICNYKYYSFRDNWQKSITLQGAKVKNNIAWYVFIYFW